MAGCKLTQNITKENCEYQVAGVKEIYLYNFDTGNTYTPESPQGKPITKIELVDEEKAYHIEFIEGTASFTDELAVNGNGGKYRTHTLNFTISNYDYQVLNEGDALSLGKFTAVVVDKKGNSIVLGRTNGLSATSFNYDSGAADADANGWTVVLAGTEMEIGQKLESEDVIKSITDKVVVEP